MTDLDKANYILETLTKRKFELEGIEDAFRLTQSYSWLFQLVKTLEKAQEEGK